MTDPTIKTVTTCPACGAKCRIGGDDKEGTHYYIPIVNAGLLMWAKSYRDTIKTLMSLNSEEIISLKLSGLIFDHHLESLEKDIAKAEGVKLDKRNVPRR